MSLSPKRRTFLLALAGASLALAFPFAPFAQEGEPPPGPRLVQHEWLAREAGEWKARGRFFGPDGAVQEFTGIERSTMACGGLWLVSDFEGDIAGAPLSGHGVVGYDPAERGLTGIWVDSTSARMVEFRGSLTESARVLLTEGLDPVTGERYDEKHVTRITGPDARIFTLSRSAESGDIPVVEIVYERVKE